MFNAQSSSRGFGYFHHFCVVALRSLRVTVFYPKFWQNKTGTFCLFNIVQYLKTKMVRIFAAS